MRGYRTLIKLAVGVAMAGGAAAVSLASPLGAAAAASSVDVSSIPFTESWSGPNANGLPGVIAHVNGSCDNHCSAVIDWGDGSPVTTINEMRDANGNPINDVMASHAYFEEGTYSLSVTAQAWSCIFACIPAGGSQTGALVETIADAPLTQSLGITLNLAEGAAYNGSVGSFYDSNGSTTQNDFSAAINWGDGSITSGTISPSGNYGHWTVTTGFHVYRTAGTYTINTLVSDHGASTTISSTANVIDVALTASGTLEGWTAGQASTKPIATFTDLNPYSLASDFTAQIAWGDGSQSAGTVFASNLAQQFYVTGTHTYANAGMYTATITISDLGGATATATATQKVTEFIVLPALSNGAYGGYQTSIYIQNVGSAPADVSIYYVDTSGRVVGTVEVKTGLAPHAGWTVPQNDGHAFAAGQAGSGEVFSSQPIAAFVNEFAASATDATSYTSIRSPNDTGSTLYAPTIANNAYGGYTTGIGLVNLGPAGSITVTYRDNLGVVVNTQVIPNVAGGAYLPIYSGTAGLPDGFAGTATIQGPGELAAVVNETGPHAQFSSYDAVNAGSLSLNAPLALNNAYGGFFTGIGIQNTSNTAGTVTIDYYDATGTKTEKVRSIAGYGYIGLYQGDVNDGPPASGTGYTAVLTGTVPIAAIVNEVAPPAGAPTMSTAYNTFKQGAAEANLALVESAGSDGWSTGLGVMNTGSQPTTVTLSYYDVTTGNPVGSSQTQIIQPNAFWGPYQPTAGLPAGMRATAVLTTTAGGQVAVICNEAGANIFMSYEGQ
jgi:hypothetical protein